jgi:hypothetical protein
MSSKVGLSKYLSKIVLTRSTVADREERVRKTVGSGGEAIGGDASSSSPPRWGGGGRAANELRRPITSSFSVKYDEEEDAIGTSKNREREMERERERGG